MSALRALLLREIRLAWRTGGGALSGLVFFLIITNLLSFALGPDVNLLRRTGAAIIWIALLLASLPSLERLFTADHENGSLDILLMGTLPTELVILTKTIAFWLVVLLPMVLFAPVAGVMMGMEPGTTGGLVLSLLVGTPALACFGTLGAAISSALDRGGLLTCVLILPLTIPMLIFGVSAAVAAQGGPMAFHVPLMILGAITLFTLASVPFAAAAALYHLRD
jgi:heme exporter protein B